MSRILSKASPTVPVPLKLKHLNKIKLYTKWTSQYVITFWFGYEIHIVSNGNLNIKLKEEEGIPLGHPSKRTQYLPKDSVKVGSLSFWTANLELGNLHSSIQCKRQQIVLLRAPELQDWSLSNMKDEKATHLKHIHSMWMR